MSCGRILEVSTVSKMDSSMDEVMKWLMVTAEACDSSKPPFPQIHFVILDKNLRFRSLDVVRCLSPHEIKWS